MYVAVFVSSLSSWFHVILNLRGIEYSIARFKAQEDAEACAARLNMVNP
jgi:hypothetical protein